MSLRRPPPLREGASLWVQPAKISRAAGHVGAGDLAQPTGGRGAERRGGSGSTASRGRPSPAASGSRPARPCPRGVGQRPPLVGPSPGDPTVSSAFAWPAPPTRAPSRSSSTAGARIGLIVSPRPQLSPSETRTSKWLNSRLNGRSGASSGKWGVDEAVAAAPGRLSAHLAEGHRRHTSSGVARRAAVMRRSTCSVTALGHSRTSGGATLLTAGA